MLRQLGQAMVEYTIVTAAFVTGLLVLNNGACPAQYEDCIEYLLTTMHDNADGYSNSITAVQDYGKSFPVSTGSPWPDPPPVDPPDGGGGSPGEIPPSSIQQATQITSADGGSSYGVLDGGNVVGPNGNIVGTFNAETGEFTPTDGFPVGAVQEQVVQDEAGNVLEMQAVVDCDSEEEVKGFGYRSKASGKFVTSLSLSEANISGLCLAPAYEVTTLDGGVDGGRIVNGKYYAVSITATVSDDPIAPTGEVVYWSEYDECVVMVSDWDTGIDSDLDEDERYEEQKALYNEPDSNMNPRLGKLNSLHYAEQTLVHGQSAWPNNCVSARTLP